MHFTYYEIFNVFGVTLLVHNNIQAAQGKEKDQGCQIQIFWKSSKNLFTLHNSIMFQVRVYLSEGKSMK